MFTKTKVGWDEYHNRQVGGEGMKDGAMLNQNQKTLRRTFIRYYFG